MTRFTKLYSVGMLLLCILFSNPSFAFDQGGPRTRIPQLNWGNSMGILYSTNCVTIPSSNVLEITLALGMARNDLQNFPPLYVGYDWGGYSAGMTPQITANDLVPVEINGYNVYEAQITFLVEINNYCTEPNPSEELLPFNFQFDLLTMDEGFNVEAYPVLYEGYPLFPSYIFPEVGELDYTSSYSGSKTLCCASKASHNTTEPGAMVAQDEDLTLHVELTSAQQNEVEESVEEVFLLKENLSDPISKSIDNIRVFPNPASEYLNVDLNVLEGNFYQIDIIDLKGQTVKSIYKESNSTGKYLETIRINDLISGMYFCRIHSQNNTQSFKVTVQ